jgi:pimeloyl-ACP methyl ester carboxylesterase
MSTSSKPTILLVPGAWIPSECYDSLRHLLDREGYNSVAVDHPSVGSEPADQTLERDVAKLSNTLSQLIDDEDKEVVLFLHSYGTFEG